ncbi:hypothetical protein B7494_g8222 [Chlorociboria aeruginascens]|nr:hypothetical protein B7494_g8222 [Chlorociboria aeruginascens]
MLAVQRPQSMGSKPPNLEMPFGYSFDNNASDFRFPSPPPPPAPGASLLDDNESKFLDNFLDGVSSEHFNYDFFTNAPDGSELGLGWDEIPPAFMGTASSFGQQPQSTSNVLSNNAAAFHDASPRLDAGPSLPSTTSADVLAAATLLQNGSNARSQSMSNRSAFGYSAAAPSPSAPSIPYPLPSYPAERVQRYLKDNFIADRHFADMVYGEGQSVVEARPRPKPLPPKIDLRWGSDSLFSSTQGFVDPSVQNKIEAVERSQIEIVDQALAPASSEENTRPSSPVDAYVARLKAAINTNDEGDEKPRRRRKSKYPDEEDGTGESPPKLNGSRKRKSIHRGTSNKYPVPSSEQGAKRRKSSTAAAAVAAAAAARGNRENLTEDQKRENHIKSEQKRRTLIREGFEDLNELVPGLRGGGFSKSATLIMAADWLEDLLRGNEVLNGRIVSMEGKT